MLDILAVLQLYKSVYFSPNPSSTPKRDNSNQPDDPFYMHMEPKTPFRPAASSHGLITNSQIICSPNLDSEFNESSIPDDEMMHPLICDSAVVEFIVDLGGSCAESTVVAQFGDEVNGVLDNVRGFVSYRAAID